MIDDLPFHAGHREAERDSFNAAFYELGLRWHWDTETYDDLLRRFDCATQRIRHYLEAQHPHLLKAYDAAFLVEAIQQAQLRTQRVAAGTGTARRFDWAQTLAGEIGA